MDIVLICTIFNKSTIYTDNLYFQLIKGVVCINPSDAHNYLANSYRPYQLRNNKLAATYDGAHGRAVQAHLGMTALQNGMAASPTALAGAGRLMDKGKGAIEEAGSLSGIADLIRTSLRGEMSEQVMPVVRYIKDTQIEMQETQQKVTAELRGEIESSTKSVREEMQTGHDDLQAKVDVPKAHIIT